MDLIASKVLAGMALVAFFTWTLMKMSAHPSKPVSGNLTLHCLATRGGRSGQWLPNVAHMMAWILLAALGVYCVFTSQGEQTRTGQLRNDLAAAEGRAFVYKTALETLPIKLRQCAVESIENGGDARLVGILDALALYAEANPDDPRIVPMVRELVLKAHARKESEP